MLYIRQNATHKVVIGPVVAVANGYVPVTTLALNTADEAEAILHDNATVVDISGYTFAAITTADGYYHLTLQSGISGTVGHMTVVINDDSLCLPVKAEFTVLEEAVYDQYFAASAAGAQVPIWAAANSTVNLSATTIKTATDVETDTADIQSKIGTPAGASVSADVAAVKADTAAILVDTGTDGVVVAAGSKTGYSLTSAYDFAKGTTAMTEAYAANGAAPTPVEAIFAIHQYLMQFGISSTNYTVKKLDNTTTAFVVTLDDATTPSAAART